MDLNTLPAKDRAEVLAMQRRMKASELRDENERLKRENAMLKAHLADAVESQQEIVTAWLSSLRRNGVIP